MDKFVYHDGLSVVDDLEQPLQWTYNSFGV